MANDKDIVSCLESIESSRYEELIADERFKDNPLLPELRQLHEIYRTLAQRTERLLKDKSQLETQLINLNRSLDLATRIDAMTGLANRRSIMEKIDQEFSRSHRHNRSTSIIMADIDNFKQINDTYSFNTGDDVLVEVARVFRGCLRSEDICARWGGEEFLVLLPETPLDGALSVANKIRESIAMTVFSANRCGISLTVSLGVCEYKPDQNFLDAIKRADQAMLQAKQAGKNRALVAP
jgi:diguanylate cyclase (GGDEF)-like protein